MLEFNPQLPHPSASCLVPQTSKSNPTKTARKHHGSRAKCNFDERGNRNADVRIKINNSPQARARYMLLHEESGEGGEKRRKSE